MNLRFLLIGKIAITNAHWIMNYTPKKLLSVSTILMSAASRKPLAEMNQNELNKSVEAAVRCARLLVEKCSVDGGLTVREIPGPAADEFRKRNGEKPEWIRLPKTGVLCPHSGLSRSKLNELVLPCVANGFKPPVKSICLRKRGAARGCRLISLDSLMNYLSSLPCDEGEAE